MIKQKQLKELKNIIDYLNTEDNVKKEKISDKVENVEDLLLILSSVKTSKIRKILSLNNKLIKDKIINESNYTELHVKQIFESKSSSDIISEYSKTELQEMFFVIYGRKPRSNETKESIVNSINKMFLQIGRSKAFTEMDS